MQNQAYYAILPASVRYDNRLKASEKLIYCELTCLCKKEGYCWATNAYFANLYGVSKETVSRWFSNLQDCGYIKICLDSEYDNGRRIILFEQPQYQMSTPIDENVKPILTEMSSTPMTKKSNRIIQEVNNTRLNNLYSKNQKRFLPPTLDEIKAYCKSRNSSVDPIRFYEFYTAEPERQWIDSNGKPVKSWKQKILTWESRQSEKQKYNQPKNKPNYDYQGDDTL